MRTSVGTALGEGTRATLPTRAGNAWVMWLLWAIPPGKIGESPYG
jgi:hypothetical protein